MWWTFNKEGSSGFSADSTAEEVTEGIDGFGLTAIITRATRGIGAETARVLALRGVHVIMAVRNVVAGTKVTEDMLKEIPTAKIDIMEVDISSFDSVRKFASEFISSGLPLNILINNAGVKGPFRLSKDKIELTFATNHLGHFLLTDLLLETMKTTSEESGKEGRIINVSSVAHSNFLTVGFRFDKWYNGPRFMHSSRSYIISKLANVLHANNELARQLKEKGYNITANSLHPGVIDTDMLNQNDVFLKIFKAIFRFSVRKVEQGAATTCYVALHPEVKGISGQYFEYCKLSKANAQATDVDLARELWNLSINLINKTPNIVK